MKYKNIATVVISIGIPTHTSYKYSVYAFAQWNKRKEVYEVSLYLKRSDIDMLELIEKAENIVFDNATANSIRLDIVNYVEKLIADNFFYYYISRYKYEQKCFDRGNDLFERERLSKCR